jgi:hypothetical protein
MKKTSKKEHPEIKDIKNVCEITPKSKNTKNICEKINKEKLKNNK